MRDARSHELRNITLAWPRLRSSILDDSSSTSYYVDHGNTCYLWNGPRVSKTRLISRSSNPRIYLFIRIFILPDGFFAGVFISGVLMVFAWVIDGPMDDYLLYIIRVFAEVTIINDDYRYIILSRILATVIRSVLDICVANFSFGARKQLLKFNSKKFRDKSRNYLE